MHGDPTIKEYQHMEKNENLQTGYGLTGIMLRFPIL